MNDTGPDKFLIFTADDFGLSDALNAAVALAHRRGLLKCAALMAAAPDPAAQLMELSEAEALCALAHDDGRIGHIYSNFHHRSGN